MPHPDVDELLDVAVTTAQEAGRLLLDGLHRVRTEVETKSSATDMVTEMDRASEALVAKLVQERRPHDGMVGEEGTDDAGTSGVRWVVDPLDGTTNYLYGYPMFAVSMAAEHDGATVVGVVHHPSLGETFTAIVDRGSFLNGRRLRIEPPAELATALVGTGFSYRAETRAQQGEVVAGLIPRVRDVRRSGSAALDLSWVGAGRLDAFYEWGLAPWDLAAGALVAAEAGARVEVGTDGVVLAAPPNLFDELRALLRGPSPT